MTRTTPPRAPIRPAPPALKVLAWLLAAASVAFAAVNVGFEVTERFEQGPLSEYAAGLSIANWFVTLIKLIGGGVALLSVWRQSRIRPLYVNILIWAAAGSLGIYALGSGVQALGLTAGPADYVYLGGFLLVAIGFITLAISHSRRSNLGLGPAAIGVLGGIVLLGVILLALPMFLTELGIMPAD